MAKRTATAGVRQPAIVLEGVGLQRSGRWILRDINWHVPAGSCAAILGPNGSGKSTLARIIACHLWPGAGRCCVLGQEFGRANLPELRRKVRLLQPGGPYEMDPDLTARQATVTGFFNSLGLYDRPTARMWFEVDAALAQVGLAAHADQPYGTLSSGERVRCLVARALVVRPRLLLLDEPTAALDLLAREQVLATVQSLAAMEDPPTVVLITHRVEELPPSTGNVLLLDGGKAAATGAPGTVLRSRVLSRVYGCPVQVRRRDGRFHVHVHPRSWRGLLRGRQPSGAFGGGDSGG